MAPYATAKHISLEGTMVSSLQIGPCRNVVVSRSVARRRQNLHRGESFKECPKVIWKDALINPSPSPLDPRSKKWIRNMNMYTAMGTTIKQTARAIKWSSQVRGLTRRSPHSDHNWLRVDNPMVAIIKRPTHLTLPDNPNPTPVKNSHMNQSSEKGSLRWLWKLTQASAVNAVKRINGESSKIRRLCVTMLFSMRVNSMITSLVTPCTEMQA